MHYKLKLLMSEVESGDREHTQRYTVTQVVNCRVNLSVAARLQT
jgi:hypothetical protein